MRSISKIISVVAFLSLALTLKAGNPISKPDSNNKLNYAISIVPSYTLQNGFRFDLDIHLKENQWLVFGPHLFIARNQYIPISLGLGELTDMDGYGFDLYHKMLLKKNEIVNGPYFAYGIRYDHFSIKFNENGWVKKTDSWGTPYYEWEKTDITEKINRYGFNLFFGVQYSINSKLLIDAYTGCGVQVADVSPDDAKISQNNNFLHYNYSGPKFLLGFRFGMFLH